jgi:diguanylate cyclase (GGDEF)-like protein
MFGRERSVDTDPMSAAAPASSPLDVGRSPDVEVAESADPGLGRGVSRRLGVVVGIYFTLYVAWRVSAWGSPGARALIDAVALALPGVAAVVAAGLAVRRCAGEPRTASAWRWITVAYAFLAWGFVLSLGYQTFTGHVPFPSAADAALLIFYPFMLIGLMRLPQRSELQTVRLRLSLDATTLVLAGIVIVWFLVLGPAATADGRNLRDAVVASGYPIGDLLLLFGLAYVISHAPLPSTRRALQLLVVGTLVAVVGDLGRGWLALHTQDSAQVVVDVFNMAAWGLYLLAAASQRSVGPQHTPESDQARPHLARPGRSGWLPYVAPAAVFALLIYSQLNGSLFDRLSLAIGATLVAGLVLGRQFLAQRDLLSAQGQLTHQALHDALTGLPNRLLVLDRAAQMLARATRQHQPVAALFVDIDDFKRINDTFGHAAGDELIRVVAARLATVARAIDTVGRLSGDEFVVLLDGITFDAGPELVAQRVLDVLRRPIDLGELSERAVAVSVSIGIAVGENGTADELLRDADLALYGAKGSGKDRFLLFQESMQTAASDRLLLAMDLREALRERQFFLLYQPTFDLQTESMTGVEALIRWGHPTRGVVAPDRFIPLAEENGIIVAIGRWVLEEACRQAAIWQALDPGLGISVNVSARQLERDEFIDEVRHALVGSGLDPGTLTLEITETVLMRNADAAALRLDALKALGARIAIDDFGTGYSSLAYLRQFHVDAIKIDRSFISGIAASQESAALIHTLVQLGRTLGLQTLGEGIEEPAQLQMLRRQQCDLGQGFLFARPLEVDAVERLLASTRRAHGPRHLALPTRPSA